MLRPEGPCLKEDSLRCPAVRALPPPWRINPGAPRPAWVLLPSPPFSPPWHAPSLLTPHLLCEVPQWIDSPVFWWPSHTKGHLAASRSCVCLVRCRAPIVGARSVCVGGRMGPLAARWGLAGPGLHGPGLGEGGRVGAGHRALVPQRLPLCLEPARPVPAASCPGREARKESGCGWGSAG